ncbi:MAG: hypothetical protein ACTXOO_03440 [Sodalis sp. (in: enterobacteria)]
MGNSQYAFGQDRAYYSPSSPLFCLIRYRVNVQVIENGVLRHLHHPLLSLVQYLRGA